MTSKQPIYDTESIIDTPFARDVIEGLSAKPKHLSSRYFYDARGSELFEDIMRMDAYYLTNCEFEIFEDWHTDFYNLFSGHGDPFQLIEFGAGDGLKTKVLLRHFLEEKGDFTYKPIDISNDALQKLAQSLQEEFSDLDVAPMEGEYFEVLHRLNQEQGPRKIVLFLGSNIGNFTQPEAIKFLRRLGAELNPEDLLLIGFDLKKDPDVILHAYDDPEGITREFNMNLLRRINNELGGNFDLRKFRHYPTYNPDNGEARSYIISTENQTVTLESINKSFRFEAWEPLWLELSQKYDHELIEILALKSGFEVVKNFTDHRKYFVDSVWKLRGR